MPPLRIGIDTGGTFTDVAVLTRGRLSIHKVPSTPDDPARAVLAGLGDVRGPEDVDVVHGTTVGLNAVLTGSLARTALVTNQGFRDLCEIGRQERSGLYDLEPARTVFPVPRDLRFELPVRRDAGGKVVQRASAEDIDALAERLSRARVESVAIGLLHSYRDPRDERAIARRLARALRIPVTCSADLLPRHGEFERFAAAVVNAAIRPVMGSYLGQLAAGVRPGTIRLMRSSGGVMSAAEAAEFPARAAFSGPAGGVLATARLAEGLQAERVAALDMGGTSTDVALVGRTPSPSEEHRTLGGLPLALPSFDVHTIGCGGGSIAYADRGGALRVGPISAGADPGPACYGRGDEPTVTDAHVALGNIGAETLLGGSLEIDPDRAVQAIERLAARLGTSARRCATGILEIAEIEMMRALLVITSQRAVDPAGVPLVAYGGAGGLHAAGLARRLSMPAALIPNSPGAFSAIGLALAAESEEVMEAVLARLDEFGVRSLVRRGAELARRAADALGARAGRRAGVQKEALLRFVGQGQGLWVPLSMQLERAFRERHQQRFGFLAESPVEVVELRARAQLAGPAVPGPAVPGAAVPGPASPARTARSTPDGVERIAPLGGRVLVVRRESVPTGASVRGPVVLAEPTAVVCVPSGFRATNVGAALRLAPDAERSA